MTRGKRTSAALAVLLLAALAYLLPAAALANQRALMVTASPAAVPARGGETTIRVQVSAADAGAARQVTLSTELGAFTSASGPPEIHGTLFELDDGMLGLAATLVGDGRVGLSVVRAQVGPLVNTVTVRFGGEAATLRVEAPSASARLDASREHRLRLTALDATGQSSPMAQVTFQLQAAPAGATLRAGGVSSLTSLTVTVDTAGSATAVLQSGPGLVRIRASSGEAAAGWELELYGAPQSLRLVSVPAVGIEAGAVGAAGSLQALLLDERGQGVPNQRITIEADAGVRVAWDGEGESALTDVWGTARAHLDASAAEPGPLRVTATWLSGDRTLTAELPLAVTGPPAVLYLRAEETTQSVEEQLLEVFSGSTRYEVTAEVQDEHGNRVAGSYQVRWRPKVSAADAQVYPQVGVTQDGLVSAIFDLQHEDGVPHPQATVAQAWLIAKPQVNDHGFIGDLLGAGRSLHAGVNELVWQGDEVSVAEALAGLEGVVSAAWRRVDGVWQAWFPTNVPGGVEFTLEPGGRFSLVLSSAARMPGVERR